MMKPIQFTFATIAITLFFLFANITKVSAQTQMEMNQTAGKDFEKSDAELNKSYKELMLLLDAGQKKLLVAAQKNWLKFRDSHCAFEEEQYEGGSIQPLIYCTCLTELTVTRTEELKQAIEGRK